MSSASRILLALVVGLLAGIALGAFAPGGVEPILAVVQPIGAAWLNGLQMTIVPLVVALLVTGIATTAQAARAGRLAGRAIGLYVALLTLSAAAAAVLTPLFLKLVPLPVDSAARLRAALATTDAPPPAADIGAMLAGIVPGNAVKAAAENAFLPLIVFTLVFAFALMRLPARQRDLLVDLFTAIRDTMLVVIGWVLWIGPLGVGALAIAVGARAGSGALGALLHYILVVAAVGVCVSVCAYPLAVFGARRPLGRYARAALPSQAVAVSTQSSLASLPAMLAGARALDVPVSTAGVTLPLAVAVFRATGPAMNFAVAIYVATWFGVTLSVPALAVGVLVATLTSLGSVSLPGTISFVSAIAPICSAIGAPVAPLGLLVAVETLPDIVRTLGNVMMDLATTATLSRWNRDTPPKADEGDAILDATVQ